MEGLQRFSSKKLKKDKLNLEDASYRTKMIIAKNVTMIFEVYHYKLYNFNLPYKYY